MFELFFLFVVIVGVVLMIKVGALLLHLIFIPFQILGGLFVALLAAPLIIILLPILLLSLAVAGFVLLSVFGICAGSFLSCLW